MFSGGSAPGVLPLTLTDLPPPYAGVSCTISDAKVTATDAEVDKRQITTSTTSTTFTQPSTIVRTHFFWSF